MKKNGEIVLSSKLTSFIENIAGVYEKYGIPRIGGRIFGLCLVVSDPLSAEDISELLQASRSSVSTNIRGLIANGWIEKVTFPGDRIDYFKFSPMAWQRVLEHRKNGLLPLKIIVERGQEAVTIDTPEHEQLREMEEWIKIQIKYHDEMITAWQNYINNKK